MELYHHNGIVSVIRHIFEENEIEVGTTWISSGGLKVKVLKVEDDWVEYLQFDGSTHEKSVFCFQVRYCLIVEDLDAFRLKYAGQFKEVDTLF